MIIFPDLVYPTIHMVFLSYHFHILLFPTIFLYILSSFHLYIIRHNFPIILFTFLSYYFTVLYSLHSLYAICPRFYFRSPTGGGDAIYILAQITYNFHIHFILVCFILSAASAAESHSPLSHYILIPTILLFIIPYYSIVFLLLLLFLYSLTTIPLILITYYSIIQYYPIY